MRRNPTTTQGQLLVALLSVRMAMTRAHVVRDNALALTCVVVLSWILELCGRPFVARWAWVIVMVVAIAVAVPALMAIGKAPDLSTRSRWIWRAVVIALPVAGPLAWFVLGENPTWSEWMLFPVIGTAILVLVPAIGLSVRDYGWPTEPPYRIEVDGRNYLHPREYSEVPEPGDPYRKLATITPVPPFGRFPVLADEGSGTPTIVYMEWWDRKFYSYTLSGGP
ncbi:PLDc N-terminal domain-containing protein [Rhodococcus erythropolis]|uniref:PLDc N-terminal domain-containing protein n=1 Tax=Rhodococcus erythropolis TaxID=1833 RepID=UPI00294A7003|nr:PLDc N-terminal domain-containing protein [Rhodococcus erythropolis]MDV6278245.1 PLDc N-terminal domain-containing protein [Rhodococcus erythropolis]